MGNAGNEKQAAQKKGGAMLCATHGVVGEGHSCGRPLQTLAPSSAEKLALRGEPTARMLVSAFVNFHSGHVLPAELRALMPDARAYLSTRAQQEEEERDGWQRDRLQVLMLQEQAVKDRDDARDENTRLVGWNQKAAHRLRLSLSELRSFVDRATRDGVATTAAYRSLCDIDGEATLLATGAAPPSDKQAIRQPGVAARAPAEEALIEAARAYKLEDIRTGHVVAEIGQRASLYAIGTASEALCAAARAIPISPTAVHDVLMASAASADKTDPDLATGLRTRAALALPVEGRAPDASHEKKLGKKGVK